MKAYPQQYIGGEWRTGSGEAELTDRNPYTGEILYTYRSAGKKDLDDAYRAAADAQKDWAATTPCWKVWPTPSARRKTTSTPA